MATPQKAQNMVLDTDPRAQRIADWITAGAHWDLGHQTRVWLCDSDRLDLSDADLLDGLDPASHARARRLRTPGPRRCFAASRLLVEAVHAKPDSPAHSPGTETGQHATSLQPSDWAWSWTRSQQWAALARAPMGPIGIDLEIETRRNGPAMLDIIGSPAERAGLARLAEPARTERFLRVWTGKEAILKAHGTGFRGPARAVCLWAASEHARPGQPRMVSALGRAWHVTWIDHGCARLALARPQSGPATRTERPSAE